jgi:23S rRNA (cytidine1920-2'-O)/16S rRNA (cytidine1409-2'-O)-methyltransferase
VSGEPVSRRAGGRIRLDQLMVLRGLARSRERARALLMSGAVRIDGRPAGKAGTMVAADAGVAVVEPDHPYVGRGGLKLAGALDRLGVVAAGRVVLDIGSSTGGFTDCLLRRGARRIYAVDVGVGQLDWSLRNDPRVVVLEGRNARYLEAADLPGPADLAVVDVSFISLRLIVPVLPPLLLDDGEALLLVKPQFEVGRREVGAGGIVRDPEKHLSALRAVAAAAGGCGFRVAAGCPAPIRGAEGNQEYFLHCPRGAPCPAAEVERILGGMIDGD